MIDLAPSMRRFQESASTKAGARARELKAAGHKIVDFSIGEPDFAVPDNVKQAILSALERDDTHYTNVAGTPALLDAIRLKFRRENGLEYGRQEVMAGAGAKQVMFNAFAATVREGDEVIVPRPYWISYPNQFGIAGGVPVYVDCDAQKNFHLDARVLERAISLRTRWLILNSPNNPSGAVFTRAELRAIADVLLAHPHVLVMSDEIYEHLIYGKAEHHSIAAIEPRLKPRTLVVNGVSKAYAMTGLRIGYAAGPAELIQAMTKYQSQVTSCPSSISQAAAEVALSGPQDIVKERRKIMEDRANTVVRILSRVQSLRLSKPEGAMYAFCDCRALIGTKTPEGNKIASEDDFIGYLLDQHKVVVVPGAAYGIPGYFRLSFATSTEAIEEGCERIARACASLNQ